MIDIFRRLVVCSLVASLAGGAFAGDPPPEPVSRLKIATSVLQVDTEDEFRAGVLMDTTIDGTQGWSFGVGHNPEELMLLGAESGALTAIVNDGDPPQFLVINTEPAGGGSGRQNVGIDEICDFTKMIKSTKHLGDLLKFSKFPENDLI